MPQECGRVVPAAKTNARQSIFVFATHSRGRDVVMTNPGQRGAVPPGRKTCARSAGMRSLETSAAHAGIRATGASVAHGVAAPFYNVPVRLCCWRDAVRWNKMVSISMRSLQIQPRLRDLQRLGEHREAHCRCLCFVLGLAQICFCQDRTSLLNLEA